MTNGDLTLTGRRNLDIDKLHDRRVTELLNLNGFGHDVENRAMNLTRDGRYRPDAQKS
jgi:hypothetical protein